MKILSIQPSISAIKKTVINNSGKNLLSRIFPTKATSDTFQIADKPLTANLKVYYKTAFEKLNDIYLERVQKGLSTVTVEHNINQFKKLPKVVQDATPPEYVSIDGHVDHYKIEALFKAAKGAGKTGYSDYMPSFWGRAENVSELTSDTSDILAHGISASITEQGDLIVDAGSEPFTEFATEALQESFIEGIIDHIINIFG